jgi:hypothetical protein
MKLKELKDKKTITTLHLKEGMVTLLKFLKDKEKVTMSMIIEYYVLKGVKEDYPELIEKFEILE